MQLSLSAAKIWFYNGAVDFRKSINGLVFLIDTNMKTPPGEGIFVFCNRNKDKVKILTWHGNGFVLLYKRLERGKFTVVTDEKACSVSLDEEQLQWLLAGLDWNKLRNWDKLTYDDYY